MDVLMVIVAFVIGAALGILWGNNIVAEIKRVEASILDAVKKQASRL